MNKFYKTIKKIFLSIKKNYIDNEVFAITVIVSTINFSAVALFQDFLGKEEYIKFVNTHWYDAGKNGWIGWLIFILIGLVLLNKIFEAYKKEKEENVLLKKYITIYYKDRIKEYKSNRNKK